MRLSWIYDGIIPQGGCMGFLKSFKYAIQGIYHNTKAERNFRIQIVCLMLVIVFGFVFSITRFEWIVILLCSAGVLTLELMNTAVESTIDLITKERHPLAKKAKDVAAGAVLVWSLFSAVIGATIFMPYILALLK
jgi:undecaprenol kinase